MKNKIIELEKSMYIYRRADKNDLEMILRMNHDFRNFIGPDSIEDFLDKEDNWLYICQKRDQIIGFGYGYLLDRLDGQTMFYLHELGILGAYQRMGIGRELMEALEEDVFETGASKIFLMAHTTNEAACGLYDKIGGQTNQEEDVVYFFKP